VGLGVEVGCMDFAATWGFGGMAYGSFETLISLAVW
jgi:hypothetical protein